MARKPVASPMRTPSQLDLPPASAPTRPASLRLRYRVLTGQVRFIVAMRTGFAGDGGPDSCIGPHLTRTYVFDGGGPGLAFATHDSGHFDLAAYPNGEVAIRIVGLDGAFEVLLDDIGFNFEGERVFDCPRCHNNLRMVAAPSPA